MSHQVGQARHKVPVAADMDASGMNAEEHVVVPELGLVDVPKLENVR